jgi:hypothetical protein
MPDASASNTVVTAPTDAQYNSEAFYIARLGPEKGRKIYREVMNISADYKQFVVGGKADEEKDEARKLERWNV